MARIELRDCTVRIKDGLGAHPDVYPCVAVGNKTLTPGKTAVASGRHQLQGHEREYSPGGRRAHREDSRGRSLHHRR